MRAGTEVAMSEWLDGQRRMAELDLPAARRSVVEAVVEEIVDELRRRVGSTYSLDELAEAYEDAAGWCLDVAQRTTGHTWAYDLAVVQDAAFARFARQAVDFRRSV
jgi:hypothetical protein